MLILCSGTGRDNAEKGRARPQVAVTAANVVVGAESKLAKAVGGSLRPFKNSHAKQKVVLVERQKKSKHEVCTSENANTSAETSESGDSSTTTPVVAAEPQIATQETVAEFVENLIAQELTLGVDPVELENFLENLIDELNKDLTPITSLPLLQPPPPSPPPQSAPQLHRLYSPRRLWHKLLSKLSRRSAFTSL